MKKIANEFILTESWQINNSVNLCFEPSQRLRIISLTGLTKTEERLTDVTWLMFGPPSFLSDKTHSWQLMKKTRAGLAQVVGPHQTGNTTTVTKLSASIPTTSPPLLSSFRLAFNLLTKQNSHSRVLPFLQPLIGESTSRSASQRDEQQRANERRYRRLARNAAFLN